MKTYIGKEASALFNHHMGENVRMILFDSPFSCVQLAKALGWTTKKLQTMIERDTWPSDAVWKASLILGHNFFKSLSNEVDALIEEPEPKTIRVDDDGGLIVGDMKFPDILPQANAIAEKHPLLSNIRGGNLDPTSVGFNMTATAYGQEIKVYRESVGIAFFWKVNNGLSRAANGLDFVIQLAIHKAAKIQQEEVKDGQ